MEGISMTIYITYVIFLVCFASQTFFIWSICKLLMEEVLMEMEIESMGNACYIHVFTDSMANCIFPDIGFILWIFFFHCVSTSENALIKFTMTSSFNPVHTCSFSYWIFLPHFIQLILLFIKCSPSMTFNSSSFSTTCKTLSDFSFSMSLRIEN